MVERPRRKGKFLHQDITKEKAWAIKPGDDVGTSHLALRSLSQRMSLSSETIFTLISEAFDNIHDG